MESFLCRFMLHFVFRLAEAITSGRIGSHFPDHGSEIYQVSAGSRKCRGYRGCEDDERTFAEEENSADCERNFVGKEIHK